MKAESHLPASGDAFLKLFDIHRYREQKAAATIPTQRVSQEGSKNTVAVRDVEGMGSFDRRSLGSIECALRTRLGCMCLGSMCLVLVGGP